MMAHKRTSQLCTSIFEFDNIEIRLSQPTKVLVRTIIAILCVEASRKVYHNPPRKSSLAWSCFKEICSGGLPDSIETISS